MFKVTKEEFREELIEDIKASIPFEAIGKFLPFQTRIIAGASLNHIQSTSIFVIHTDTRNILDGDTLCGRGSNLYTIFGRHDEDCPGCEAIGKNFAVRDLL